MLEIQNLTHTYANGIKALNAIHLDIPKGMYGLLGPNGAGKSTLMRVLATLQSPTTGQVLFEQRDVLKEPMSLRKVLGYLPQDFGVYPRGSALQLLDYLAILKGISAKKVRKTLVQQLLEQTNLWEARKRPVSTFSGGMRQRFGIAQALIGRPKLLIVDEPTAGLDPEERNRFHNLLADLGHEMVILLSTHLVEDVEKLCPKLAILSQGQIVAQGTPQVLKQALVGRIWSQNQASPKTFDQVTTLSTQFDAGQKTTRVLGTDLNPNYFTPSQPTLEDVYFAATRPVEPKEVAC